MRDLAERSGAAAFWRWWTGELRGLVPAASRAALKRRRVRPALVFGHGSALVLRPELRDGELVHVEAGRIPLEGEAATVDQAGRAAIDALARGAGASAREVTIALAPGQVLSKRLVYPSATEENLAQVVGYDLDRHTPFKPEELYYDAAVVGRDPARKELEVELAAALRNAVDGLRRQAAAWGAVVTAVSPDHVREGEVVEAPRLNLLPPAERPARGGWRQWTTWAPIAVVALLVLAAIAVPLWQKRVYAIELLRLAEQARVQAAASDALRTQLEQATGDYNYVLERKYAFPSTVQVLDDVTRLLPDDTWLTQLELKSGVRGKDTRREIMLRGESINAGRLVSLLEDSKLFEQAAPRSPTTKVQPGPGEIFDLGAQLKPLVMPAPVQLAATGAPASAAPGVADAARRPTQAGAGPAPSAATTTTITTTTTAGPSPTAAAPAVSAPVPPSATSAAAPSTPVAAPPRPSPSAAPPAGASAAPPGPQVGSNARAARRAAADRPPPPSQQEPAGFGPVGDVGQRPTASDPQ